MSPAPKLRKSRLRVADLLALGFHGSRARPLRAVLSSLGIAIGIAAMISVIGISTSSQARITERLESLGTNLLTVTAGTDLFGNEAKLPIDADKLVARIPGVQSVGSTAEIPGVAVYRNANIDEGRTGGLQVTAASLGLLEATGAHMLHGNWLTETSGSMTTTVLGKVAAERLGIRTPGSLVWLGDQNFTVVGILDASPLVPELDSMALIGTDIASERFGFDGHPTVLHERSDEAEVTSVRKLLPQTIQPESPGEVKVSRPSDALAAKNIVDQAFTRMLVGVGSVALLVGGIGVANTMVISVLERRREIGLRRALGATRAHIRQQFMLEAVLLSVYGGVAGVILGWTITAVTAWSNDWLVVVPPLVLVAGIAVTVVTGAIAGLLPAMRAAKTTPTEALAQ